jgi:hypothetical protein
VRSQAPPKSSGCLQNIQWDGPANSSRFSIAVVFNISGRSNKSAHFDTCYLPQSCPGKNTSHCSYLLGWEMTMMRTVYCIFTKQFTTIEAKITRVELPFTEKIRQTLHILPVKRVRTHRKPPACRRSPALGRPAYRSPTVQIFRILPPS